jgi:pimeloyl-ACP methyl ester carboxylesterase
MPPLRDAAIRLPDGRHLAYAEWGDPHGSPVLFFHGTPHSRLWCPDERATISAKVRLITVDRPGIGRSDIKPARTYADWPGDVVALAEALGITRFAVVGWSAGGLYAASCATLIAPRLTSVGVVSNRHLARYNFGERPGAYAELASDERAEFDLAQRDPMAAAELAATHNTKWVANLQEHPESIHDPASTAEGDRWFFADKARAAAFDAAIREGLRQGMDGLRWELIDGWFPWGFRLAEIPIHVYLWHGKQDSRGKQADIDFIASHIPECTATTWPDAGHLGIAKHWDEVLGTWQ